MVKTLRENYVEVDDDSYELLKSAKNELDGLESRLADKIKENIELAKTLEGIKKDVAIAKVVEGLTPDQAEKAKTILEDVDADKVEDKFENIRDMIIESSDSDESDDDDEDNTEIVTEQNEEETNEEDDEMKSFMEGYKNLNKRD